MEIITDIALTEQESRFYKKFKNLSINETPKPQGDGVIKISPFDDYFIFTLYDEIDGVDSPIDLSNVGTIYMVFIGGDDEIRIPNYTNVQDISMSDGQVLFKISKNDSKKILALSNRNFYISTMMVDPDGNSDESIIYIGSFLSIEESAEASLSAQLEELRVAYAKELAAIQENINKLNQEIAEKNNVISQQDVIIAAYSENNQSLSNEIGILTQSISSTVAQELLQQATDVQLDEEKIKKTKLQTRAIQEVKISDQTKSKKRAFFEQASKQLRSNIPGVIPINTVEFNNIR
jgi:predicted nucleotidyltransferase